MSASCDPPSRGGNEVLNDDRDDQQSKADRQGHFSMRMAWVGCGCVNSRAWGQPVRSGRSPKRHWNQVIEAPETALPGLVLKHCRRAATIRCWIAWATDRGAAEGV